MKTGRLDATLAPSTLWAALWRKGNSGKIWGSPAATS